MSKGEDEIVKRNKEEEEKKRKLLIEEKQPEDPLPIGEGHETKVIDNDEQKKRETKSKNIIMNYSKSTYFLNLTSIY
jgi:hypothetical protein